MWHALSNDLYSSCGILGILESRVPLWGQSPFQASRLPSTSSKVPFAQAVSACLSVSPFCRAQV